MPDPQGFSKTDRLLQKRDFQHVFADNKKSGNRYFLILVRANHSGSPRLGLAIAKKHLRRAVDRNRIKRIVRESFRQHKKLLGGIDVVVLSRSGCQSADNRVILGCLEELWQKVIQ